MKNHVWIVQECSDESGNKWVAHSVFQNISRSDARKERDEAKQWPINEGVKFRIRKYVEVSE